MEGQLQSVIDEIFPQYDKNNSGTLDTSELAAFFNDAFKRLGYKINVTQQQAVQSMQFIDKNSDKQAGKTEIFTAMKQIISKRKPSQPVPPPPQPQPQQGPTNPGWNQPPPNNWNQQPQPQHNWEQPLPNNYGQPQNNWQQPGGNTWEQPQPGGWGQQYQPGWNSGQGNQWGNQPTSQDEQFRQRIDAIYMRFDRDRSGTLEAKQLVRAFNQLLADMGIPMSIDRTQARQLLASIDSSEDGRVDKEEFFRMLKFLLQPNE